MVAFALASRAARPAAGSAVRTRARWAADRHASPQERGGRPVGFGRAGAGSFPRWRPHSEDAVVVVGVGHRAAELPGVEVGVAVGAVGEELVACLGANGRRGRGAGGRRG